MNRDELPKRQVSIHELVYEQLVVSLYFILGDWERGLEEPWRHNDLVAAQVALITVCEHTKMTVDFWAKLTPAERLPWLERTVEILTTRTPLVVRWVGGRSYSLGDGLAVNVSHEENEVLDWFLEHPGQAACTGDLPKGINVSRVMKSLDTKFPGCVRFPAKRGDGYVIPVENATDDDVSTA